MVIIRKSRIFYKRICSQYTSDKFGKCSHLCLKTKKIEERYFLRVTSPTTVLRCAALRPPLQLEDPAVSLIHILAWCLTFGTCLVHLFTAPSKWREGAIVVLHALQGFQLSGGICRVRTWHRYFFWLQAAVPPAIASSQPVWNLNNSGAIRFLSTVSASQKGYLNWMKNNDTYFSSARCFSFALMRLYRTGSVLLPGSVPVECFQASRMLGHPSPASLAVVSRRSSGRLLPKRLGSLGWPPLGFYHFQA